MAVATNWEQFCPKLLQQKFDDEVKDQFGRVSCSEI